MTLLQHSLLVYVIGMIMLVLMAVDLRFAIMGGAVVTCNKCNHKTESISATVAFIKAHLHRCENNLV